MYLIAGLGNPGREYEATRHNVGFVALDMIAEKLNIKINKVKFKGLLGETRYAGKKLLLLKPQTYVNLSGQSVLDTLNFYKIPTAQLIVIYDDMDLPVGQIRIRPSGGSAGHKGVDSIIYQLSSEKFLRVRVGIGRPDGQKDAAAHVLSKFYDEEIDKIKTAVDIAAEAALKLISDGIEQVMNIYNGLET